MLSAAVRAIFYFVILPGALVLSGWQGWSWWSWAVSDSLGDRQETPEATSNEVPDAEGDSATDALIQINIEPGTSAQQIGRDLLQAGVIRSAAAWSFWTRLQDLQGREGGFLAGTYELSPNQSMAAIAEKIWRGEVIEGSLTIPEGWSVEDIIAYLVEQDLGSETEVREAMRQIDPREFSWLPKESFDQPEQRFEGFLYPDTYITTEAATPTQVIRQMLLQFEQLALPVYEQGSSAYSLLEWVTLASIVEREAVVDDERQLIASVFARRLEEGIPLGADPTVEYALGIRQTPDRPLTYAEVGTDSPYNTYVNAGLPPGPISNPGIESLKVSLDPPNTEFLYFVARYDGTHVFSRTLTEHQQAQGRIRDRIDRGPAPDAAEPNAAEPNASPGPDAASTEPPSDSAPPTSPAQP